MRFAASAGMSQLGCWKIGIVVAELASNVLRHAHSGVITLSVIDDPARAMVVLCRDTGPGLQDPELARSDGYSRGRQLVPEDPRRLGLGAGLGAIERLMDEVEIRSVVGHGTEVIAKTRF
jgi:serine/threonine-protein kinase RsbT